MTGRERIEAAFSKEGAKQIPAVICYERLFSRDHWNQLSPYPWWYWYSPDVKHQLAWRLEAINRIGQDWLRLVPFHNRDEQEDLIVEAADNEAFLVSRTTGQKEKLKQLVIGGEADPPTCDSLPETFDEIDQAIPIDDDTDPQDVLHDGRANLAQAMMARQGKDLITFCHVLSPLWSCYTTWGFEGMMILIAPGPT